MISMAVAALLLCSESIQAQSRTRTRTRTERRDERRDDRYIPQDDPRRTRRAVVVEPVAPPVQPPRIRIVDNDVIRTLEHETFDSDRLKMADMVFNTGGYMTTAQITRVSESFDFDSNRIKFLKKAYENCVDAHNYYLVLKTIDFSSSREKLIEFVLNYAQEKEREGEIYQKAVSSSDMSLIIKTLKAESFDSTREKIAKMIICGHRFSSRQIADMAKTFEFDSSRKKFLIYAHPHCADPQNYVVAANTLEFSSSRNDVMNRVSRRP